MTKVYYRAGEAVIPVKATEIAYDMLMNPIILLINEDLSKVLPIWIGPVEANSISLAFQGVYMDRPLTHDLLINICGKLEANFSMVLINDIVEGNYIAELHMWHGKDNLIIDSRPSDAIAIAIRTQTPIYLTPKVAAGLMTISDLLSDEQQQDLRKLIDSAKIVDMKKQAN